MQTHVGIRKTLVRIGLAQPDTLHMVKVISRKQVEEINSSRHVPTGDVEWSRLLHSVRNFSRTTANICYVVGGERGRVHPLDFLLILVIFG